MLLLQEVFVGVVLLIMGLVIYYFSPRLPGIVGSLLLVAGILIAIIGLVVMVAGVLGVALTGAGG